jgi:putative transposase
MPRKPRVVADGGIYHVINRGNGRQDIFHKDGDFRAFLKVLAEACERFPSVQVLCYCLMHNHWHLILRVKRGRELGRFMQWLGVTHVRRHHAHYHTEDAGGGHLYQGRFKSFPTQDDVHYLTVCRYVESNAVRARIVRRAQDWPWSSLRTWMLDQANAGGDRAVEAMSDMTAARKSNKRIRQPGVELDADKAGPTRVPLAPWPVPRPAAWLAQVNQPLSAPDLADLHTSVTRGRPFGTATWVQATAKRLGLTHTLRPRGRPRKTKAGIAREKGK